MMTPVTKRFVTIVGSQVLLGGALALEGASFAGGYLAGHIAAVEEWKGGDLVEQESVEQNEEQAFTCNK